MTRTIIARLLWMVPMLFGVTVLTFAVLDASPIDRAEAEIASVDDDGGPAARDSASRRRAVRGLRERMGLIDAAGNEISLWRRYLRWVEHAIRFDFATVGEDAVAFRARFGRALAVSSLLGLAAITLALLAGCWFGQRAGLHVGGVVDRVSSPIGLVAYALPEFVVASLLVLIFGGGLWSAVLPANGLRSSGSGDWPLWQRHLDLAAHLVLPTCAMALAPFAIVLRYVRDATVRAGRAPLVGVMRDLGVPRRSIRESISRHGRTPVATLLGSLLPAVVGGSLVVEQVFSLPGLGRMTFDAVLENEVGFVMASTLLGSVATLVALLISDLTHRALDPRVELR